MLLTKKYVNRIITVSIVSVLLLSLLLSSVFMGGATPHPIVRAGNAVLSVGNFSQPVMRSLNSTLPILERVHGDILVHRIIMNDSNNFETEDMIITGDTGAVHLVFDGANVVIGPNSKMQVTNGGYGNSLEVGLFLLEGSLFADVYRPLGHNESFLVHTQVTHVSVLGTAIHINHDSESGLSEVGLLKGHIAVACVASGQSATHYSAPGAGGLMVMVSESGSVDITETYALNLNNILAAEIALSLPGTTESMDIVASVVATAELAAAEQAAAELAVTIDQHIPDDVPDIILWDVEPEDIEPEPTTTTEPATTQPTTTEPTTTEPATTEPATTQHTTTEPAATEPATTQPTTTEPTTTEPATTTEPPTTQPPTTQPPTTQPPTTQPPTTQPPTTQPPTTQPPTTQPPTTQPPTTQPPTTQPTTTQPPTTQPPTTQPPTTQPTITQPPTTQPPTYFDLLMTELIEMSVSPSTSPRIREAIYQALHAFANQHNYQLEYLLENVLAELEARGFYDAGTPGERSNEHRLFIHISYILESMQCIGTTPTYFDLLMTELLDLADGGNNIATTYAIFITLRIHAQRHNYGMFVELLHAVLDELAYRGYDGSNAGSSGDRLYNHVMNILHNIWVVGLNPAEPDCVLHEGPTVCDAVVTD